MIGCRCAVTAAAALSKRIIASMASYNPCLSAAARARAAIATGSLFLSAATACLSAAERQNYGSGD